MRRPARTPDAGRDRLTYAPVGGSQDPALPGDAPRGYAGREDRARIGHGTDLFTAAGDAVLRWAIQERVGIQVVPDRDQAAEPRRRGASGYEHDPLRAGDRAVLHIRAYGVTTRAPIEVVLVADDPHRRGFAYGTLPGHPESGEVSFMVELDADLDVWFVVRSFSRPATWWWRIAWPFVQHASRRTTAEYLRVATMAR